MSSQSDLPIGLSADLIAVERAIAEMRAGRPIALSAASSLMLYVSLEAVDEAMCARLTTLANQKARLLLPAARLRRLGRPSDQPAAIAMAQIDMARITTLALAQDAQLDAPVQAVQAPDDEAFMLAALSFVLPTLVALPVTPAQAAALNVMSVEAASIPAYRRHQISSWQIMARAPVPLEGAAETEFVIFRGGEGMRDQVAVVVGRPNVNEPVIVRLHSACLTGDLFGSLKCDCGDQLRHTVRFMAEQGGGILLYLDQEGRGNGLANKIRAYRLQAQGFDTYDADEVLGFDHDQRRFAFAAHMLKHLGVSQVRVMTNNPLKIKALEDSGLHIVADERIWGRKTEQNRHYLASKRDRAGHMIDMDEVPVYGGTSDKVSS